MVLKWILVFALTLVDNIVTSSQPCQRLFMQGLDNIQLLSYAKLSGLYSLTNTTIDKFPTYRHEIHPNEFFFYNGTRRVLTLGRGFVVAETNGRLPRNNVSYPFSGVITRWGVYRPATKSYQFVSANYIRPLCTDADPGFQRCDSGQLTFSDELTFEPNNGRTVNVARYEQLYGRYTDYRPIYKALVPDGSSVEVYLYHANGTWRLGHDYTTSTFGKVNDTALRPEFITGDWQFHYNGVWRRNNNLKVRCSGNTSATLCSQLQCQNGGKCITAGSQNVQCSCPRGYRGQHCEHRVPSCQYFGNWTDDYGGWWYTGDSYEGSLAAWFCPSGSRPEFGYSVCENRFNRPSWSNGAECQSLTTITQLPWIRSTQYRYPTYTRYRYPSHTERTDPERTDLFEDANDWLIPVVVVCVVLVQIFAPFLIYYVLISCCGYKKKTNKPFKKADEMEDIEIASKYGKQSDELESRTPKPENAVMIAELRRILQQLEEEVDQVQARRRQRDREQLKTVKLLRVVSQYYYVSFWLWMIYLIIGFGAKLGMYGYLFPALAGVAVAGVILLPIVIIVESWHSSERKYIKNLTLLSSATQRIESMRNTQPCVSMNAECYHYELRYRTVSYTDANGNLQSRLETYQEKVVTAFIVEPYLFTHWFDSSQSTLTDVNKVGITKIKMELSVQFGDQTTAEDFQGKFRRFQIENRNRDTYVNCFVLATVVGFEKRLAVYTGDENKPGWISSVWFWLATIFCLGWPYRIMFNRNTGKTDYSVEKVIFHNTPSNPAVSTDPEHAGEPPSENAEDTIKNIKSNIDSIFDHLLTGTSTHDGEVQIKCAATDQHMNVTLRAAHHAPQTAH